MDINMKCVPLPHLAVAYSREGCTFVKYMAPNLRVSEFTGFGSVWVIISYEARELEILSRVDVVDVSS